MPDGPIQRLPVLVLVRDLLFSTKITATARADGIEVKLLRSAEQLAEQSGDRLIVDLNQEGAITGAAIWRGATGRPVIGFVSHVDADTVAQARAAGIDRVVARSFFVDNLSQLLAGKI